MVETSPESMTMARQTLICYGNSGDPIGLFEGFFFEEYGEQAYKASDPNA